MQHTTLQNFLSRSILYRWSLPRPHRLARRRPGAAYVHQAVPEADSSPVLDPLRMLGSNDRPLLEPASHLAYRCHGLEWCIRWVGCTHYGVVHPLGGASRPLSGGASVATLYARLSHAFALGWHNPGAALEQGTTTRRAADRGQDARQTAGAARQTRVLCESEAHTRHGGSTQLAGRARSAQTHAQHRTPDGKSHAQPHACPAGVADAGLPSSSSAAARHAISTASEPRAWQPSACSLSSPLQPLSPCIRSLSPAPALRGRRQRAGTQHRRRASSSHSLRPTCPGLRARAHTHSSWQVARAAARRLGGCRIRSHAQQQRNGSARVVRRRELSSLSIPQPSASSASQVSPAPRAITL